MSKRASTILNDPLSFIPTTVPDLSAETPAAEPPVKQISVRLPVPLYRRLKVAVAKSDESQQDYIARVLERHLRDEPGG